MMSPSPRRREQQGNDGAGIPEGTFANNDERVQMLLSSRPSLIGRVRTCTNVSALEWLFVIISSIAIGIGFGFTIYRISTIRGDSDDIVFSMLVIANLGFSSYYLFHGIFLEQPFEILMLILTTVLLWFLIMANFLAVSTVSDHLKMVRFLVSSCLTIPMVIIGCFVGWRYWNSARLIFKTVGGDIRLQTMCKQLYFAYSLLAFDGQAMLSCVILILRKGVNGITTEQIFIIITGAIFTGLWLVMGYTAMRLENMGITWLFGICSIVQPVYVIFLFIQAIEILLGTSSLLTICIFIASGTLLITHFSLLAMVPIVSFNYGKGLKEKIYGNAGDDNPNAYLVQPGTQADPIGSTHQRKDFQGNRTGGPDNSSSAALATQPLLGSKNPRPPSYESIVQIH